MVLESENESLCKTRLIAPSGNFTWRPWPGDEYKAALFPLNDNKYEW